MGFLRKARHMAGSVADQASAAAGQALAAASDPSRQAAAASGLAKGASDLADSTRESMDVGRKVMSHAVDKIDPDVLADIISKATLIQERVNTRLLSQKSAYRIGSLSVTVSIPPNISFGISRIGDLDASGSTPAQTDALDAAEVPDAPLLPDIAPTEATPTDAPSAG
jgi:hypothetical protein